MKYSTAIAVIAATGAYADLQTVKDVLTSVSGGIEGLETAAQSFSGNVGDVKSEADRLVAVIKKGKSTVDGSSDLTIQDALGLTSPVQDLTKKSQALLTTFKSKRPDVEKVAACDTVRSELGDINENSQGLIKSVVSKVPKDAQSIAESLASELTKVLAQAQDDFSEANCKNSGGATKTGEPSKTSAATSNTPTATESAIQTTSETPSEPTSEPTSVTTLVSSNTVAPTQSGNATATGNPPNVTAGASFLAPGGALALAVVAALL
ncbi:hypothetical protein E4U55_007336 [Claviceps digitariae]|nr:hypothetical protein E4U55_007336 [Claviceps digitariae]